jgi:hypothetical protein
MLLVALVFCGILLIIANLEVRRHGKGAATFVTFIIVGLLPFLAGLVLLPVILFGITLSVMCCWGRLSERSRWRFLPASLVALLVVFGICAWLSWRENSTYVELRKKFPYESMETRLPLPKPAKALADVDKKMAELEDRLETESQWSDLGSRVLHLRELHEETTRLFVNSSGFGIGRLFKPRETSLVRGLRKDPPLKQPGQPVSGFWSPGELQPGATERRPWLDFHQEGIVDFVHPAGFGFFKDRQHVAGFQAHQFSRVPSAKEQWQVQTVDLVSLLMHEEPVAYVSEYLPRMDQLQKAPTRPLDPFETTGLAQLRQGEELFFGKEGDHMLMLGAIRNAKQCMDCHGGERGDLLGAFSYTLKRNDK